MKTLFEAAGKAMAHSHSPYSDFPVGAAIRTAEGDIFAGTNVENAAFPEGICAETSAIAHMVVSGKREIAEILVIASRRDKVTPCGGCRQRIAEFGNAATLIHLCDSEGVVDTVTLAELLPHAFGRDW